jgi:hypothetical protein
MSADVGSSHSRAVRQIMGVSDAKNEERLRTFGNRKSLFDLCEPMRFGYQIRKLFVLLASPKGFEPVLSP